MASVLYMYLHSHTAISWVSSCPLHFAVRTVNCPVYVWFGIQMTPMVSAGKAYTVKLVSKHVFGLVYKDLITT